MKTRSDFRAHAGPGGSDSRPNRYVADSQRSQPATASDPTTAADQACSEYLLVCQATSIALDRGHWHFSLETAEGHAVFDAGDQEIGDLNRLTLLAAVRGLEAIDGAASVTLLSNNRYLIRSLTDSLPRWRENDFAWEHFGRRMDVQHADLWRRIDRALSIHRVEACLISSRLISTGPDRPKSPGRAVRTELGDSDDGFSRIDGPHREPPRPKLRAAPKDRLRRWLLAGQSEPPPAARHRFTSADLVASS